MASPERLGRFRIQSRLGSGAMGVVYAAWDPELGRNVAIKVIKAPELQGGELARFRREAQVLARLTHPNIVAIHDIGNEAGAPFIVMELVQGVTLASEISTRVSRVLREKLELTAQICDALALVHAHDIIHRDVKPANILITSDGAVKLADFGLARLQSSSLTGTADVVGTPAYLAPEAFSGEALDARADVYGIAASLFEWISGSPPHAADHLATLMARVLTDDAPDLRRRWADCPPALAECLGRGLARDRARRFQSAGDFATALRAVSTDLDEDDQQLPATIVVPGAAPIEIQPPGRMRILLAASALIIIIVGAIAAQQIPSAPSEGVLRSTEVAATSPPAAPPSTPVSAPAPRPVAPTASRARPGLSLPAKPVVTPEPGRVPPTEASVDQEQDEELQPSAPALPIGTKLLVAIRTVLRTDRTARGTRFDGVLVERLIWNGREAVAAGSPIQGIVDHVVPGQADRPPAMLLSLTSLAVGGVPRPVRTARYEIVAPPYDGGARFTTLIVGAVAGAGVGGILGGASGAAAGAALGAATVDHSTTASEYVLGDRLTFRLAEPMRFEGQ